MMDKKRYEKEIEEILAKYDEEKGRKERPRSETPPPATGSIRSSLPPARPNSSRKQSSLSSNLKNISAGQYMLAAFGLAILAIFVRAFSPGLAGIMVILAVALFLVPIFLHRGPSGGAPQEQKHWRGQVIDFSTRRDITNDPFAAIKRWFRRK